MTEFQHPEPQELPTTYIEGIFQVEALAFPQLGLIDDPTGKKFGEYRNRGLLAQAEHFIRTDGHIREKVLANNIEEAADLLVKRLRPWMIEQGGFEEEVKTWIT